MRRIVIALAVIFAITACKQQKTEGFVINGSLKGDVENAEVKIYYAVDHSETALDSTVIKDGKFQLKGKIEEPGLYQLVISLPDTTLSIYDQNLGTRFYLENSVITFDADAATMTSFFYNPDRKGVPAITGSATEDLSKKLKKEQSAIRAKYAELDTKLLEEYHRPSLEGVYNTEVGIRYQTEIETLSEQNEKIAMQFIKENPASVVSLDQIWYWLYENDKTPAEWDEIIAIFEPHWSGKKRFEEFKNEIAAKKNMAMGVKLPDAEFLTAKGDKVMLWSVLPKEKYVLVEFWASWCGPCRGEIPHLKEVKKKYPEFEIVNISIDEKDADWRKALAEENMMWNQLHNPDGFQGSTQEVYGITGIPAGFILNPEGEIVMSDARGAKLDKFLFETYGR